MKDDATSIESILADVGFDTSSFLELPIAGSGAVAFALEIHPAGIETSWRAARKLVPTLSRWPIISTCWNDQKAFAPRVRKEDLFTRFFFEETRDDRDVGSRELIARSATADVDGFLHRLETEKAEDLADYFEWYIENTLKETKALCGHCPQREDIDFDVLDTEAKLDYWLMCWELDNGLDPQAVDFHVPWYEPDNALMVLMPTKSSWETLAFMNWFGSAYNGVENYIALGKQWEREYGAELVAHYGTMLQCLVSKPPTDPRVAWQLASHHLLVGSSTASGSVRRYALSLLNHDRWFLHERP